MKKYTYFLKPIVFILFFNWNPLLAEQEKQKSKTNDYQKCRLEAFKDRKEKKTTDEQYKTALKICEESFPSSAIFNACKKFFLKNKKDPELKKNISTCQKILTAGIFSKKNPAPIARFQDKLFFADVDLTERLSMDTFLAPKNFVCPGIENITNQDPESFLFVGNHPKFFMPKTPRVMEQFSQKLILRQNQMILQGLGKISSGMTKDGQVFFPVIGCHKDLVDHKYFSKASIYYLSSFYLGSLTPYFGILFFNKTGSEKLSIQKVKAAIQDRLEGERQDERQDGIEKEYVKIQEKGLWTYFTPSLIQEFDSTEEPKNLCGKRDQDMIGILKLGAEKKLFGGFVLVAHIKNLCHHGDDVFLKWLLTQKIIKD